MTQMTPSRHSHTHRGQPAGGQTKIESMKSFNTTINKDSISKDMKLGSQVFSEASPKFSAILNNDSEYKGGEVLAAFSINCLIDKKLNIKHGVIEVAEQKGSKI
jgi:hypothetical protein